MRLWGNCIATDGIVNSVLQNIHQIDNVFNVIDQAIDYLNNLEITTSAEDFAKRIKIIPSNPPLPIVTTLPSYCKYYYTTPSFKNVFLGGLGGAGRSMILTYISMFALKNNWIVISVPDSSTWTQDHQAKP